jgi:hypothetical protein
MATNEDDDLRRISPQMGAGIMERSSNLLEAASNPEDSDDYDEEDSIDDFPRKAAPETATRCSEVLQKVIGFVASMENWHQDHLPASELQNQARSQEDASRVRGSAGVWASILDDGVIVPSTGTAHLRYARAADQTEVHGFGKPHSPRPGRKTPST